MKHPTAAIADDEALARDELRAALLALWPELQIVGEAGDGIEALRLIGTYRPDILFVDVQMPGMTGLQVAPHAGRDCHLVIVSEGRQDALAAFEHGAVDYLLKPFSTARLATAVTRLQERLLRPPPQPVGGPGSPPARRGDAPPWMRWISASEGANVRLIPVDDVCYFQSDSKYTRVAGDDREWLIRKSLKELLAALDPEMFWQVHRGTVVNLRAVAALHRTPAGNHELRLKSRRESLQVSSSYAQRFRQM